MSGDRPLVLVVDDELPIRRFLRATLSAHEYRVCEAETAEECVRRAAQEPPDLVLLDLGLPDQDGLRVIERLREWTLVPIVVLSARGQERDKVEALDRGADDYLTKPFGVGELLARFRVALRHRALRGAPGPETTAIHIGELHLDLAARRVWRAGETVHLTPIEYRLLTTLARHAGRVLTHRYILREVWGPRHSDDPRYVRVFVAGLRQKLEGDPSQPRYILTEQGVGYRFADPEA